MAAVSDRLARRVRHDFSAPEAALVLEQLAQVPETLPGADRQDPERVQAALVLPARGDYGVFGELLALGRVDFRDLLMAADLGHEGWPERLNRSL